MDKPITSPLLVGRTQEVEALETTLRAVRQGSGQVVLLAGEAGVGKSRLVADLRRRAALDHWTTLAGYCFERDAVFPYAPLIDALRAFIAPQSAAGVANLMGVLGAELVKLLPELALTFANLQPTPPLDAEAEKRRLFEALLQFLSHLTQAPHPSPLLLILEDLHWCDEISLDFLHLLARRAKASPIFLLATYRREEVSPSLRRLLAQMDRERLVREIILAPLSHDDVQTMLQAIFDLKSPVRTEFLERIYAMTEGNPFFIEEVLKSLVGAGEVFYGDSGWSRKSMQELHIPPSVQDAVQRRTQKLSVEARRLLTFAAVAGRHFDFDLLQQVTGQDEPELLALMKELIAAQLVVEETANQFAFRHALTRQAVYSGLLRRERQALHGIIGAAIERIYARALDTRVAELSYHFYEAGEWANVLDYARRAGEKAQALYAPHAAVEHFSRALTAAQQVAQVSFLSRFHRLRGLAYETLGEFELARADLETALDLARASAEREEEWRFLLDLGQLWAWRDYDRAGNYFQQALQLARTHDDPAMLGRTLNRMGNWYVAVDQLHEALRCHQEALVIFQSLNDAPGLAQTFDLLGLTTYLGGNPVQGAQHFERAIALFEALNDRQGLASSLSTLSLCRPGYSTDFVVSVSIRVAESVNSNERALQISQEIGWRAGTAYALVTSGSVMGTEGQYGQALESVQQGLALAQEIGHRQWACYAHRTLGIIYRDLLALPVARQHLDQSLALASEIGSLFHVRQGTGYLASLLIAAHELARAETLLNAVLTPDLPVEPLAQRRVWAARAELALAQEDPGLALQIVDRLLATAANREELDKGNIPYLCKLRGDALVVLRRWPEAEAALQAGLATAQMQTMPRLIWQIHVACGTLYEIQGRTADAVDAFHAARTIIEEIVVSVPDPELRDSFRRNANALIPQPRTLSPLQAAKQAHGGLTRREREVAVLIAQGKSDRAIAETLTLGVRTVEGYVANILAKLGFSARTQIAAWAVEKGLTKEDKGTE